MLTVTAVLAVLGAGGSARGGDWPQLLGPGRDGRYPGDDVLIAWHKGALAVIWKKPVGRGFSGPVAVGERVLLCQRLEDEEVLVCYGQKSGETLWSRSYRTAYEDDFGFDDGPRATPTVAGGTCYTFGAEGVLSAIALADGKLLWQVKTHERFRVSKGFFGAACSPLVAGGRVLVNVGGKDGSGIVAFDAATGDVLWKATDDEASYSSPAFAEIDGRAHALFFTRSGLVDLDPQNGETRFAFPWRARIRASVNAATPLVDGNRIFITASYQTGAAALELAAAGAPRVLWKSDAALSCHYATPVIARGVLYGFHGRQEAGPALRAVKLDDGSVLWEETSLGAGSLILARGVLWIATERGDVVLAAASPQGYTELGRATIASGTVRAFPALAHGRLFLRSETELFAIDAGRREDGGE